MKGILIVGIIAVVVVVAVGGAYATGIIGSDDVRDDLRVNDYIEYETTYKTGDGTLIKTEIERYEIVSIDGNRYSVKETDGLKVEYENMSKREFLDELYNDDVRDFKEDGFKKSGTETISTPMGKVKCDVYTRIIAGMTDTAYFGVDNGILYKEIEHEALGVVSTKVLDTSLFS